MSRSDSIGMSGVPTHRLRTLRSSCSSQRHTPPPLSSSSASSPLRVLPLRPILGLLDQTDALLSTLTEDNFESNRTEIRRIAEHHGKSSYVPFFRRLVVTSGLAPRKSTSAPRPGGSLIFRFLLQEIRRLARNPFLADRFCDSIDQGNSDVFVHFDFIRFVEVIHLSSLERFVLASSLLSAERENLVKQAFSVFKREFMKAMTTLSAPSFHDAAWSWSSAQVRKLISNLLLFDLNTLDVQEQAALISVARSTCDGETVRRILTDITPTWDRLATADTETVQHLLQQEAPWRGIEGVPKAFAGTVLDELQSELDRANSRDLKYRRTCIKCLRVLRKKYSIIPSQFYIPSARLEHDNVIHAGGAYADICRGTMQGQGAVCLKILRIQSQGQLRTERVMKAFCHEALIWSQLCHDNVLPCYGVSTEVLPSRLCLISPWMGNGNILKFLETNPSHDRRGCIWDVAAGMQYLHDLDPCIIHKDIRGANILVGDDFRCRLSDFGISLMLETRLPTTSTRNQGNIRWLPPELIEESDYDPYLMREVDIYSFGCTITEIYTGKPPYSDLRTEGAVLHHKLVLKKPPVRPPTDILPPELWDTVVTPCLASSPKQRPSAKSILDALWKLYSEYLTQHLATRGAGYVRT